MLLILMLLHIRNVVVYLLVPYLQSKLHYALMLYTYVFVNNMLAYCLSIIISIARKIIDNISVIMNPITANSSTALCSSAVN